jgi:hypothetical protein
MADPERRQSLGTAVVRTFEYEDWPRGRIVFDRLKERLILYADRKLMLAGTIAQVRPDASCRKALLPQRHRRRRQGRHAEAGTVSRSNGLDEPIFVYSAYERKRHNPQLHQK